MNSSVKGLFAGLVILTFGCGSGPEGAEEVKNLARILPSAMCGGREAEPIYMAVQSSVVRILAGPQGRYETECFGVAVAQNWILTAGHCVTPGSAPAVVGLVPSPGRPEEVDVETGRICRHPKYQGESDPGGLSFDLALVPISQPHTPISTIAIGKPAREMDSVIVLAWGLSGHLERTESLTVLAHSDCAEVHEPDGKVLGPEEFCAGVTTSSIHLGASGSPVLSTAGLSLVGIVSDAKADGYCRDPFDIHTHVDPVVDPDADPGWIAKVLASGDLQGDGLCEPLK